MIVVSDTSPINYLIWIGEIDLLQRLYERVILPKAVQEELTRPVAPALARAWATQPPEWVEVQEAETLLSFAGLGPGETEAISLARSLKTDFLLIDERKGRRIATEQGIAVSGTLLVLELAAEQNLIDLSTAIERLKQTSFHVSDRVIQEMLTRDQARRQNQPSRQEP